MKGSEAPQTGRLYGLRTIIAELQANTNANNEFKAFSRVTTVGKIPLVLYTNNITTYTIVNKQCEMVYKL